MSAAAQKSPWAKPIERTTAEKVQALVADHLGVRPEQVQPTASFAADLGCDSLDTVELAMLFEEAFGIEIPDDDLERIGTVNEAVATIERIKGGA